MMNSIQSPRRIAVLGGGITGLTAAYALACARQGGAPVDEFLLEARDRPGGLIQTQGVDGFTFEGGPDSFLTAKREASDLCRELGLELSGSNDSSRRTLILRKGRLEPLPDGLMFFIPTKIMPVLGSRLIPFASKATILRDALRRHAPPGKGDEDESVASFVRCHLGKGVVETIVDPLMSGVYGGDVERLSARAILHRFVAIERERGSLVRPMLRSLGVATGAEPVFTTLKHGMGGLAQALAEKINAVGPRVFLNQTAESIEIREPASTAPGSREYRFEIFTARGARYQADAIILALPAYVCSRLLAKINWSASQNLATIPYTPAVTVALGYPKIPQGLPAGFGFLTPRREGRHLIACTFVHSKFPGRTPPAAALLRCFLGGDRDPDAAQRSDDELAGMVDRDLADILGIKSQPAFRRFWRWPAAMPQYVVGHEDRVARIERAMGEQAGLFLAGNAYRGVGIPDCIRSAKDAARRACEFAAVGG